MDIEMHEMTFGQMKSLLGGELNKSDCQRLCAYFSVDKSKTDTVLHAASPGIQVLTELTDKDVIQEDDVSQLEEALRRLKLGRAANFVLTYQERFGK